MLAEREDIHLSRSTVRRVLLAGGLPSPRRRKAPRRDGSMMLLQIDGSRHDCWRAEDMTLVGAVDDATGTIQTAGGCYSCLKDIIAESTGMERSPKEPEIFRRENGRALEEFIRLIMAHTPQAKGRVERAAPSRTASSLSSGSLASLPSSRPTSVELHPALNQLFGGSPARLGLSPTPIRARPVLQVTVANVRLRHPATVRRSQGQLRARTVEVQERLDGHRGDLPRQNTRLRHPQSRSQHQTLQRRAETPLHRRSHTPCRR